MSKVMHHKKSGYQRKMKKGELNSIFYSMNSDQSFAEIKRTWRLNGK